MCIKDKNQWNHPSSNFIKFLHVNGNHWITISNIGVGKGIVNIYDSLQMNPTAKTENLIAQFIKSDFSKLLQPVQKQKNGYDCGVFAIAFATSILNGDDPAALLYSTGMRKHLLECLIAKEITPFPSDKTNPGLPIVQETRELGCYCRGVIQQLPSVQCTLCSLKCHTSCIPCRAPRNWICETCKRHK